MQIDVIEAQINKRPDGSIEVLGQSGHIVFTHKYAEKMWGRISTAVKAGTGKFDMRVALNIEVEEPTGKIVRE